MSDAWKTGTLKIISGSANMALSRKICDILAEPLCEAKVGRFADGEIDVQIMENVRGDDCYIIQPTCPPVNENIMELLITLDALRRASAGRITAVVPYYGYGRADRKPAPRVAITAKLVANLITSAGADRVVAIDLHAAQIQGFFDIPMDHLYARPVVLEHLKGRDLPNLVVVSPDVGSVERARSFAKRLNAGLVIIDKRRPRPNEAMIYNIIGSVEGMTCFIFDDLVDTAGTLVQAANALKERGAAKILAACTHGVLSRDAFDKINASPLEELILTDTIPVNASKSAKINVISVAPLLAEAIKRNHIGKSISELFK
ncbi:MAG: ribose-phosphate pyrophosphokinase [Elusimicrobia bacterium GWC2_51_8]|nr:MAG: ribose-phosphate pyrophosphokinase [Elusimicrobia bacterium GWA2_51_34]OGR58579.1 MAG: ribose-phosphate pyrophosphokinase [Elusimicrobia bacterium GWC2_51_8]OGR86044.1 MAG: ribose-phosphate pyrophosphokinase [Elusimicrobia bacterium GWF2_52_66]HAF95619.1 ribose-phosphate pyrophosphokinase [Elusimicrobiota bacterium]HCE98309.1 ribose-phosphate pyrophosphokinase [Elusimicrobiota bacterium]